MLITCAALADLTLVTAALPAVKPPSRLSAFTLQVINALSVPVGMQALTQQVHLNSRVALIVLLIGLTAAAHSCQTCLSIIFQLLVAALQVSLYRSDTLSALLQLDKHLNIAHADAAAGLMFGCSASQLHKQAVARWA